MLDYAPLTGVFTWRRAPNHRPIKVGDVAGNIGHKGYVCIGLDGVRHRAHRLAWFWMTGAWPLGQIDHEDMDKSNNRWVNLRDVSHAENQQNRRDANRTNCSSGLLGASWHVNKQRWLASISVADKSVFLGYYDTPEAAHARYVAAKRELHSTCTL